MSEPAARPATARPATARPARRRVGARSLPLLVTVGVLAGCGAAAAADRPDTSATDAPVRALSSETPSWLFALDGTSARVAKAATEGVDVTIAGASKLVAFTDRPVRDSKRLPVDWLVQSWSRLFADDAPNGVLSGEARDGRMFDVVVEVQAVRAQGDALVVRVVGVGADKGTLIPTELDHVALFIDDVIIPTDALDWTYHVTIPKPDDSAAKTMKTKLATTLIADQEPDIYSFPVTHFSTDMGVHHLDEIQPIPKFEQQPTLIGV